MLFASHGGCSLFRKVFSPSSGHSFDCFQYIFVLFSSHDVWSFFWASFSASSGHSFDSCLHIFDPFRHLFGKLWSLFCLAYLVYLFSYLYTCILYMYIYIYIFIYIYIYIFVSFSFSRWMFIFSASFLGSSVRSFDYFIHILLCYCLVTVDVHFSCILFCIFWSFFE